MLALASAFARDQLRRSATLVLGAIGVLLVLSLRYFSAFGLGYETVQLRELGVYSIGLTGALAVLIFSIPREEDDTGNSETLLLVRPLPAPSISAGMFAGRLAVLTALQAVWAVALSAAIAWFAVSEPVLFSYRGQTSIMAECQTLIEPLVGQWLVLAILLAVAQAFSRFAKPLLAGLAVVLFFFAAYAAGATPALSYVLPDFSRYDLTPLLWGEATRSSALLLLPHGVLWIAAALAVDSAGLRLRLAA